MRNATSQPSVYTPEKTGLPNVNPPSVAIATTRTMTAVRPKSDPTASCRSAPVGAYPRRDNGKPPIRATIDVATKAAAMPIPSNQMKAPGRHERSCVSMTWSFNTSSQPSAAASTFEPTTKRRNSRNALTRGCMRSCGEMLLDVLRIPRPADDTGVDSPDAHAQLPAVAALHFASLGLNELCLMHLHIGVQLALGQRHRIETSFGHSEMLRSELPSAADRHAVTECAFACGEDHIRMQEFERVRDLRGVAGSGGRVHVPSCHVRRFHILHRRFDGQLRTTFRRCDDVVRVR